MRNTRLYIIISVVVLIIVGIIASILSNQLKKGSDTTNNKQSTEKIESSGTRTLSRTEKYKEASRITKQSNTSLLSDSQVKKFDDLCSKASKGLLCTDQKDSIELGCSSITNHLYIQEKTTNSKDSLNKCLTDNDALDILQTDKSLFVKTDQPLANYIKTQENYLLESLDDESNSDQNSDQIKENKNGPTPNPYEEKVQKDLKLAKQYLRAFSLFKFEPNIQESQQSLQLSPNNQQNTIDSLSQEDKSILLNFNSDLPIVTPDFEFGYSNITNEYYLYKKTSNADQAFSDFLDNYDKNH